MASSLLTVTPNMLYVSWAGAGGLEFEKLFPVKILLFFFILWHGSFLHCVIGV